MDKVSVIIPVYNSSKHLNECLDSVIRQSYKNLEIIIVDDNSTDNSVDLINNYKDKRIKLIKLNKNRGVAFSRNKGIDMSTGSFIAFIDSDDFWKRDKIKKQVNFIKKNDYTFIYSDYTFYKNGKTHDTCVPKSMTYEDALKNTAIFTSTVMFNMKYLTKKDIYMPDIKRGQDTACWWRILKKGVTAFAIKEPLSIYRVEGKTLSSNKFKALKRTWLIYKRENLSFFKRIFCFFCYVFNAIKRRI